MATSTLHHHTVSTTIHTSITPSFDRAERMLRRIGAWILLGFFMFGELGLAWDIQWHALIGRDRFWTPPHILIYFAVAGAGLTALVMVLIETLRYRRGVVGVDDTSTVRLLRVFHAPLGFILTGCGPLIDIIAAPFDNYWHQLYGIDITLWSPFHMMGAIGGIVGALGLISVFASEQAIDRRVERLTRRFLSLSACEWGALILLTGLLRLTFSALTQFPSINIGPLAIVSYPLPLTLGAALCLVSAMRFTRRTGTGAIMGILVMCHTLVSEAFVPWGLRIMVTQLELHYRFPGRLPFFNVTAALLPLIFVAAGLLVDTVALWQRRHDGAWNVGRHGSLVGMLIALPLLVGAPVILQTTVRYLPQGVVYMPPQTVLPLVLSLPLTLAMGYVVGMLGLKLGNMWYRNIR